MTRDDLKRSMAAALVAAGVLFATTPAQATIVDLIHGDSGTINGAVFDFTTAQPTGTGVIQPFLRVQNDPVEQGYNTSGAPVPFDDKAGPWTQDVTLANLQATTVIVGNTSYFKLLPDINQSNSHPLLSLDQLQFYTSPTGSQTTTNVSSIGALRYSFSPGDAVYMDASRNHGSGSGDMYAYIPTNTFAGTSSSDFVYMYCHFGNTYPSNGGFEGWSRVVAPIPEADTFFPVIGLIVAVVSTYELRRRKLKQMAREQSFSRIKSEPGVRTRYRTSSI
ncbi:MAG: hypothetical protein WA183_10285 [Chthoniobacterales bacterium]